MFVNFFAMAADEILYISIIDWMTQRSYKKGIVLKICLVIVTGIISLFFQERRSADLVNSCTMLFSMCIYLIVFAEKNANYVYLIFLALAGFGMEIFGMITLGVISAGIILCLQVYPTDNALDYIIIITETVVCILVYLIAKKVSLQKLCSYKGLVYINGCLTIFMVIIKQIAKWFLDAQKVALCALILVMALFLLVFGIFWLIDHYHLSRMKQKIEQDNTKMNSDLHRTKELMPLLLSVVNGNQDLLDEKIVEEFKQIYSEQMISERKEEMNYKLLGSTGIKLLDAQVQHYIFECTKKGIQIDAFITEPVAQKIQQLKIAQLQIHRLLGDLLRNAVRAIERSEISNGKILCIIGMKDGVLEIDVFDNGMEIPVKVLEHFGKRGVTTGGTGNGLADTLELLGEHAASLVIKENAPGASAYTKGFQIIFDGRNRRELVSYRSSGKFLKKKGIWKVINPKEFAESFE